MHGWLPSLIVALLMSAYMHKLLRDSNLILLQNNLRGERGTLVKHEF